MRIFSPRVHGRTDFMYADEFHKQTLERSHAFVVLDHMKAVARLAALNVLAAPHLLFALPQGGLFPVFIHAPPPATL